jgi:hypothetical protein
MAMRTICCVVLVLFGTLTPVNSFSARDVMMGVKGGLNVANFTGDDVFNNASNKGAIAGVFARYGLSDAWSFQPEALYSMRGAKFAVDDIQTEQQTNYIEIPLLARFAWGRDAMFRPSLFAGPSVGFLLKNKLVDGAEIDIKNGSNDVDLGGVLGAGLDHDLGAGDLLLDVRYEYGFTSTSQDLNVKNSVLSFMIGYGHPLGSHAAAPTGLEGSR